MQTRRDFLKLLGITGLVAASPKFIFDYGANLYKVAPIVEPLGITKTANGLWQYVKAIEPIYSYSIVTISDNFEAEMMTTKNGSIGSLSKAGVSAINIPKNGYGWVQIGGEATVPVLARVNPIPT